MPFQRTVTVPTNSVGVGSPTLALVPGPDVTNFPMRFAGIYSYLATVANGGKVQSSVGKDIFFTSDSAGSNRLNFELVAYNPVNGAIEAYVRIPTLFGAQGTGSNTVIYLWYGQNNTVDISNRTGTWDSEYAAVYHFGNGTTLDLTDSTSNHNDGTNVNGVTAVTGILPDNTGNFIGGGAKFVNASSQTVTCGSGSSLQITGSPGIVLQSVIQASSSSGASADRGIFGNLTATPDGYGLFQHRNTAPTNQPGVSLNGTGGGIFVSAGADASNKDSYQLVAVGNPADSHVKLSFFNFEEGTAIISSGITPFTSTDLTAGTTLVIGKGFTSWDYFDGIIDEVRILNTPTTSFTFDVALNIIPRMVIEINNQMQNTSFPFYTLGPEVPIASLAGQCNNPPAGQVGVVYPGVTFTGTGGAPPYTFAVTSGSLPGGLSLNGATGAVSGTPTTSGTFPFTVTITDNNDATATFNCSILINPAGPATIKTLRFETTKKRWFPHQYADTIVTHYLDELFPGNVDKEQLLMLSAAAGFIYKNGGDTDNSTAITTWVTTPSLDGGDPRIQKLYVDVMNDMDGTGNMVAQAFFNNQTVTGPFVTFTAAGTRVQQLLNISSLASLVLYRNIALQYSWTGGPDGPRLYISEAAGYSQPYISTFFVTQYINLSFPGWKHHRRLYAGYISNSALLFTIKTQDGRTYGPYTLPSTGGQFQIVEMMLDQDIKDLAFAYQIDGQGQNFALFPEAFTIEIKEWTEPSYINLAIFKT